MGGFYLVVEIHWGGSATNKLPSVPVEHPMLQWVG